LLNLFDYTVKIRISRAQAPRQPVSATSGDGLAIGDHLKLAELARFNHGFYSEPLPDSRRETRGLGLIAQSGGAGTYLDFHCSLRDSNCRNASTWYLVIGIWLCMQIPEQF
jgi:hypothetical protein